MKVVSPLHIGCDEVYEPTSFVIDEDKQELINFEPYDFLGNIGEQERQKFSSICRKGTIASLLDVYKFIRRNAAFAKGERVALSSALVEHYRGTLEIPGGDDRKIEQQLNSFLINRTSFNPLTNLPYIPGSAIKGSLRTAVLNLRNNGKDSPKVTGRNASKNLQENLLGFRFDKLETDPFRLVKVSDFLPTIAGKLKIIYAVGVKKKQTEKERSVIPQILEVVEAGMEFTGSISIAMPQASAGISKPIAMAELLKAIRTFYPSEKLREDRELKTIGVDPPVFDLQGQSNLIRLGRHSGAECVTVAGRRSIKISPPGRGPEKFSSIGATMVWLAAHSKKPQTNKTLQPFGWTLLEQITETHWRDLLRQAEILESERMRYHQQRAEQEAEDREARLTLQAAERAKSKVREEERRRQEEEERLYPWRKVCLLKIKACIDWGQLKQCMENQEINLYKAEPEVARAVRDAAGRIREKFKKGWEADRDQKIADWLVAAGIAWPPLQGHDEQKVETALSPEDRKARESVSALKQWGDYLQAKISLPSLSLPALQMLKEKMRRDWNCHDKKAQKKSPEKKRAWDEVSSLIKNGREL